MASDLQRDGAATPGSDIASTSSSTEEFGGMVRDRIAETLAQIGTIMGDEWSDLGDEEEERYLNSMGLLTLLSAREWLQQGERMFGFQLGISLKDPLRDPDTVHQWKLQPTEKISDHTNCETEDDSYENFDVLLQAIQEVSERLHSKYQYLRKPKRIYRCPSDRTRQERMECFLEVNEVLQEIIKDARQLAKAQIASVVGAVSLVPKMGSPTELDDPSPLPPQEASESKHQKKFRSKIPIASARKCLAAVAFTPARQASKSAGLLANIGLESDLGNSRSLPQPLSSMGHLQRNADGFPQPHGLHRNTTNPTFGKRRNSPLPTLFTLPSGLPKKGIARWRV